MSTRFKKVKIIYNPFSGQGLNWPVIRQLALGLPFGSIQPRIHPDRFLPHVIEALARVGIAAHGQKTCSAEEATMEARRCVEENYDLVIAAGGDGTINAVINGLANSATALAIIPSGTINLLSLQLKLPYTIDDVCQKIKQSRLARIDLGRVNEHYFASLAGIGFDAYVIKHTDSQLKKIFGMMAYAMAIISGFVIYPFRSIYFTVDDSPVIHKGYMLIIGNVKYYGGKMVLQPNAAVTDGKLDLCVLKKKGFFQFLLYLWRLRRGEPDRFLDADFFHCKRIEVLNKKEYIQLDGDYLGKIRSATIEVVPKALTIVV